MPLSEDTYNTDWILASGSNVHVAVQRDWSTDFTAFSTQLEGGVDVYGIGTVVLFTEGINQVASTDRRGVGKIVLHDVLYAPGCVCNIIGSPVFGRYDVQMNFQDGAKSPVYYRGTGTPLAFFERNGAGLLRLRLSGQVPNMSSLSEGNYMIRANWPATERERWGATRHANARSSSAPSGSANDAPATQPDNTSASSFQATSDVTSYNTGNTQLQQNWSGEHRFLAALGLSINKPEDREEGRRIARSMTAMGAVSVANEDEEYRKSDAN